MSVAAAASLPSRSSALRPICAAGLICGAMDITAALVVYGQFGLKPRRLLQGIAGGLLGPSTYDGGLATAALGLFCHFFIAFSAATVFYLMSRAAPFLVRRPFLYGPLYGIAVYYFMQLVVVRLSLARKPAFSVRMMLIGIVIHIICVGTPIALAVRRFSR